MVCLIIAYIEGVLAIKLLILDLDGTLLRRDETVSAENVAAVRKARAQGVQVAVCTGRVLADSRHAIDALGCCEYAVCCNGATVYSLTESRYLHKRIMPWELIAKAVEVLDSTGVFYHIYVDDGLACPARVAEKVRDSGIHPVLAEIYLERQISLDPHPDALKQYDVFKFFLPDPDTGLLARTREKMLAIPGLAVTYSGDASIEVYPEGLDKRCGVEKLLDHLSMGFEDIMVIGDSENDLQLMQAAGLAVAMGNSPDYVKAAADFISTSCAEHGVAHAIEKLILDDQRGYVTGRKEI